MSKTDRTRPCKLKHAEGWPYWMPCCHLARPLRLTKQNNRRERFQARAAMRRGDEPQRYRAYLY